MNRKITFLLIVSEFVLCSCYPNSTPSRNPPTIPIVPIEITDQSWLTDEPCKSPCWYQMQVGKTTRQEAMEIIKTIEFIKPDQIREYHIGTFDTIEDQKPENKGIVFNCVKPEGRECAYLEFIGNYLYQIQVNLNFAISFEEIVERIGPPDYLDIIQNGGPEKTIGCGIRMVWVGRQLVTESFEWVTDSDRDLCYEFIQNGNKPYQDLIVNNITIVRNEDISMFEQYKWNGFKNYK